MTAGPRQHRGRSRRPSQVLAIAVVVALGGAVGGCTTPRQPVGTSRPVVYAAQDDRTGEPVSLQSLRGRPVLLSSWATWCAPCRTELPQLQTLHETQPTDGLQVVIVNIEPPGAEEAIRALVDELGLTMQQWRDIEDSFTRTFRALVVPMSILVDRDGRVVETWHGPLDVGDPEVHQAIDGVVAETG